MGKTEKGAVWLDKKLLSPYEYWQFWRNTDDRDVIKFLKMFTDLTPAQVDLQKDKNINELKILLANNATELLHGKKDAEKAFQTAHETFVNKKIGSEVNLPIFNVSKSEIEKGFNIIELVLRAKLLNSKSEIRRTIKNNGIKINDVPIDNENLKISLDNFKKDKNLFKLSYGKKNHVIIKLIN